MNTCNNDIQVLWPLRGFSLVELLISIFLGVLLSGTLVSVYLGSKQSLLHSEQMARIQENGRYAIRLLSRELSMVGFFGGVLSMDAVAHRILDSDCSDQGWALDSNRPLDFVNDHAEDSVPVTSNKEALTCLDNSAVQPGTDLLTIKRTAASASIYRGVPVHNLTVSTVEKWYLRLQSDLVPKWELLTSAQLLEKAAANPLQSYWEAASKVFYIRKYSVQGDDNIPGLCMEALSGNAMATRCLVEGVEDMQFQFGIDTDGDGVANQYKHSPSREEMEGAVTTRVHLLLRSIGELAGQVDNAIYTLGEKEVVAAGDAYLRQVFSVTVGMNARVEPLG